MEQLECIFWLPMTYMNTMKTRIFIFSLISSIKNRAWPGGGHEYLHNEWVVMPFLLDAVLSCVWLWNAMDCSPPGSSVHGASPGKNTGVGCHALLQGIFPTQGSNPGLPHCRWILYCLSHHGNPFSSMHPQTSKLGCILEPAIHAAAINSLQ